MAFNAAAAIAAAKAKGPNMTEAQAGGGYEIPVANAAVKLRFVGYYEVGKHESTWQGQTKVADRCELVFEVQGKDYPVRDVDGVKYPVRLTVKNKLSLNENSNFFKMFSAMNYDGKATHIAELLGNDFLGTIEHNKSVIQGKEVTFANLVNVRKPFIDQMSDDGEVTQRRVAIEPAITEVKLFLWDFATPDMWDAIYIPGEYPAVEKDGKVVRPAKSKNVLQAKIKSALNFKALPIYDYAAGNTTAADSAALDEAVGEVEAESPTDDLADIA